MRHNIFKKKKFPSFSNKSRKKKKKFLKKKIKKIPLNKFSHPTKKKIKIFNQLNSLKTKNFKHSNILQFQINKS